VKPEQVLQEAGSQSGSQILVRRPVHLLYKCPHSLRLTFEILADFDDRLPARIPSVLYWLTTQH
jgi:hypothetical protein